MTSSPAGRPRVLMLRSRRPPTGPGSPKTTSNESAPTSFPAPQCCSLWSTRRTSTGWASRFTDGTHRW